MNVTAHQEKEKNEETKKSKRGAGEKKRKPATNFKEAVCCPTAVVQGQHSQKMKESLRGNWHPREANSHFDPIQTGPGTAPPR